LPSDFPSMASPITAPNAKCVKESMVRKILKEKMDNKGTSSEY
jgi:hypothetical protein